MACVFHIRCIAREGHSQVIQLHLGCQLDVRFVFLGQRRRSQAAAAAVDAFMVGQRAADDHFAVQGICGGLHHAHDHTAVVEQQFVTDAAVLDQVRVVDTDDVLGAGSQRVAGGEGEAITQLEFDALVGEFGDADFRALQVAEQGHVAAVLGGQFAHQLGAGFVLVGRAVGEIQAGNIQAGDDQLFEYGGAITGWAEGGDDFGAAEGHAQTPEWQLSTRLLCRNSVVIVPLHYQNLYTICCASALLR